MYATEQELNTHIGEDAVLLLADRDGDMLTDAEVVESALIAASGEIDGYIRAQYELPLSAPNPLLKHLCIDIAIYHLSDETTITDHRIMRYRDATKTLTSISNGLISLGVSVDGADSDSGGKATIVSPGGRVFGRDNLL